MPTRLRRIALNRQELRRQAGQRTPGGRPTAAARRARQALREEFGQGRYGDTPQRQITRGGRPERQDFQARTRRPSATRELASRGGRVGGIRGKFTIPASWGLSAQEKNAVFRVEARYLKRLMNISLVSPFRNNRGYNVPTTRAGTPALFGRLRKSARAEAKGGVLHWRWTAPYADNLNRGYRLAKGVLFSVPRNSRNNQRASNKVYLRPGHRVEGRRFAEKTLEVWYGRFAKRFSKFYASGKNWNLYK